jgi:sugar phosphate isomerase/epimerase
MTTATEVLGRNRIMWGPTLGIKRHPHDMIDGAAAAGYHHVSIATHDIQRLGDDGLVDLARHAREHDVIVSFLDGFYPWLPLTGSPLDGKVCSLDVVLHQAEVLGSRFVGALVLPLDYPLAQVTEAFAAVAPRVADAGHVLALEFAPVAGITDLASALAVVGPAGFESAGIVFDTWHFYRGRPDFELLSTLTHGEIKWTQISDAAAEPQGSLWEDTVKHRRHAGDGAFDLARVVQCLDGIGALDWYGPEVISTELQALSATEAGRLAGRRLDEFLTQAFG